MNDERRRAITSTPRLTPDDVASRTFSSSFRGIAEPEVKAFLRRVADELTESRRREAELEAALAQAEATATEPRRFTDEELLDQLGEETARLLHTARDAARDIRQKAEENAERLLSEAQETSHAMRSEAESILEVRTREAEAAAAEILEQAARDADDIRATAERGAEALRLSTDAEMATLRAEATRAAELEVDDARSRAREMVDHARDLRERVLADLQHRRTLLTEQISELRTGREKLLEAYRVVKRSFLDATEALAQVEGRAAVERPDPVDPEDIAAAMRGEVTVLADDTARDLADAVVDEPAAPEAEAPEPEATEPEATEPEAPEAEAPEPEPEPAPVGSTPDDAAAAAAVEPDAAAPDAPGAEDDADGPALPDAGDLFARIRAQREAEVVEPEPTPTAAPAAADAALDVGADVEPEPEPEPPTPTTPSEIAAASVTAAVTAALRPAKRLAQDEQNAVLDGLRRQKGRPDANGVLPERADQADAWIAALAGPIADAYAAGAAALGGGGAGTLAVELAVELVAAVLDPVRARLAQAIDESEDTAEAIERVNARAREFRAQQLDDTLTDLLAGVYARGAYDAAGSETVLQWVIAEGGCSADCADNALEPTAKGQEFPTGHRHPPAHVGCRCSLTTTVIEVGA